MFIRGKIRVIVHIIFYVNVISPSKLEMYVESVIVSAATISAME